ncbi:unnamed protein product, partial [Heligmosomoides polygyrus]|uniref:PAN domain protein n=1 Tax=Heligmosomoides polygyrus TaxID=6339 RepID=A0A183GQL5_HELPZ
MFCCDQNSCARRDSNPHLLLSGQRCSPYTTGAGHECSSFEYDARSQECSMHVEDGQPFGPSVLTKTDGPVAFFQQMCDVLCSTPYGFERFPQSMLIGHAMKVISVAGLSECLSQCLTAPASHQTQCRSVMFFYETGECILNRERRTDRPELFVEGVQEQLVDYFENNCQDVRCYVGQLHWIRTEDYFISHEKDVIIESMSLEECKAVCQGNLIGSEKFPCRAFVFNAAKKECHLTAESGGEYFEKYLPFTCLETSFEQVPEKRMSSASQEFASTSVHSCLAGCLDDGAQCATAVFNYEKDLCSLSETSQFSHPELFIPGENMDYFDKICDPAPVYIQTSTPMTPDLESNVIARKETQAEGIVIDDTADFVKEQQTPVKAQLARCEQSKTGSLESSAASQLGHYTSLPYSQVECSLSELTSECRMSGVTIRVEFAAPISGAIYVKASLQAFTVDDINHRSSTGEICHLSFRVYQHNRGRAAHTATENHLVIASIVDTSSRCSAISHSLYREPVVRRPSGP